MASEIMCRAKGDDHCRFIMVPPTKIEGYIKREGDLPGAGEDQPAGEDIAGQWLFPGCGCSGDFGFRGK